MARTLTSKTYQRKERTYYAAFTTPRSGKYSLEILRETVGTDPDGGEMVTQHGAKFNELISLVKLRPAAATFLAACQAAKSVDDIMIGMQNLFDDLVTEAEVEAAAAAAAAAEAEAAEAAEAEGRLE